MFVNDMFDQFFRQIYLVGSIMNDIVVEDVVPLICEKVEIYRIEIAVFCIVVILHILGVVINTVGVFLLVHQVLIRIGTP